jgi:hypothetical protein
VSSATTFRVELDIESASVKDLKMAVSLIFWHLEIQDAFCVNSFQWEVLLSLSLQKKC